MTELPVIEGLQWDDAGYASLSGALLDRAAGVVGAATGTVVGARTAVHIALLFVARHPVEVLELQARPRGVVADEIVHPGLTDRTVVIEIEAVGAGLVAPVRELGRGGHRLANDRGSPLR